MIVIRDKPLQWMVFANGEAGFVGEHSCMDGALISCCLNPPDITDIRSIGTPTARLNDFLSKRLLSAEPVAGTGPEFTTSAPTLSALPFTVSSEVAKMITTAEAEFKDHINQFELVYHRYDRYGKDGIKAMGVSPDAWYVVLHPLST